MFKFLKWSNWECIHIFIWFTFTDYSDLEGIQDLGTFIFEIRWYIINTTHLFFWSCWYAILFFFPMDIVKVIDIAAFSSFSNLVWYPKTISIKWFKLCKACSILELVFWFRLIFLGNKFGTTILQYLHLWYFYFNTLKPIL